MVTLGGDDKKRLRLDLRIVPAGAGRDNPNFQKNQPFGPVYGPRTEVISL